MLSIIRSFIARSELGQSTILIAVLAPALMSTLGLAIMGGRAFVEFRRMQTAADMAAVIGAQSLPCGINDSVCITRAEQLACNYANYNGFGGCTPGAGLAPGGSPNSADVPPVSCSPYDFVDYGNDNYGSQGGNTRCKSWPNPPTFYGYIEVRLTDNLGTVPIFNIPITLGTHAIAKHGIGRPGDYALIGLNLSNPVTLDMQGNAHVQIAGSAFGNGGIQGNGQKSMTCEGGWFSSGSVSNLISDSTGLPVFSPGSGPSCSPSTPDTGSGDTQGGLAPIKDPYANSTPPPTQPLNTRFQNCPQCSQPGFTFDLDAQQWNDPNGTPQNITPQSCGHPQHLEMFPGVYGSFQLGNCDHVYMNPGVYTFIDTSTGVDTNHGQICVYGAPDCDQASTCQTMTFSTPPPPDSPPSATADQWYYQCSPYGYYDTKLLQVSPPPADANLSTVPVFYDPTIPGNSNAPLNGVTIYLPPSSAGLTAHGNPGQTGGVFLAAPNPCPGTGSQAGNAVSFPAGASSGTFTYPTYSPDLMHGQEPLHIATPWSPIYPDMDFGLLEESTCATHLLVWPNEMSPDQHLHFLFYIQGGNVSQNGTGNENFYGIMYAPNSNVSLSGNSGGSGPPWLTGQLIANTEDFSGDSTITIQYRPCGPGSTTCGSGPGTALIQ